MKRRVAVIAAHPDDEVLGVWGTVLRHRAEGDEVFVHVQYQCRTKPPAEVGWGETPLGEPPNKGAIERFMASWQPEIVYTHHDGDINADHRALAEAVLVACRPYAAPSVKSIRMFETPSSTEWGAPFVPNLFVDITKHINEKIAALYEHYGSEMREVPHPRNHSSLLGRANYWGQVAGMDYAEPFRVVRERW